MTRVRRALFQEQSIQWPRADQCGGGTSNAGVIPRGAAFTRLRGGLQTPRAFTDGSGSGQLTAPINPESTQTSGTRHSRRSDGRPGGQSEYVNTR